MCVSKFFPCIIVVQKQLLIKGIANDPTFQRSPSFLIY